MTTIKITETQFRNLIKKMIMEVGMDGQGVGFVTPPVMGERIKLISMNNPGITNVRSGDMGTILNYKDGSLKVRFDNGEKLILFTHEDEFEIIPKENQETT